MSIVVSSNDRTNWIPSMIDGWHPGLIIQTEQDKDNDMAFTNPQAAEIAREILDEQTKGELRERVEAAVRELTELLADAGCGSTLTFMKVNEKGKHYFYAAVKNGNTWYTTAQVPRSIVGDRAMIEWLIGLEIFERGQLEYTIHQHHDEPAAIETTASET